MCGGGGGGDDDSSGNGRRSSKAYRRFLHVCDIFCTCFVFFPIFVMYWRGIWDLWGVFIHPHDTALRIRVTIPIGALGVVFYFLAPAVESALRSYKQASRKCYYFLVRVFLYTYSVFYMCYWRALWEAFDLYLSPALWQNGVLWVACLVVLCACGTMRTAIFPPYTVDLDTRDEVLTVCTRFNAKPYTWRFFLDALFSYFFVVTVTILGWRCIWNFVTGLVIPDDPFTSDMVCLGVGWALALLFFFSEAPLASITLAAEEKGFYWKVLWEDFLYTCVWLASVLLWRGGWNSCANFMIPDIFLGGLVNHVAGTVGLMLVQLFTYASGLGVGRDGVDPGASAIFPIRYFRHYLIDKEGFVQGASDEADSRPEEKKKPPLPSAYPMMEARQHPASAYPMLESGQPEPPIFRPAPVLPYTQDGKLYTHDSLVLRDDDRSNTFDV